MDLQPLVGTKPVAERVERAAIAGQLRTTEVVAVVAIEAVPVERLRDLSAVQLCPAIELCAAVVCEAATR